MDALTDLWLIRHGHAKHHETRQLQWPEVPLSEEGHRQAGLLAEHLTHLEGIQALYSSPLPRAMDTALPIGRALGMEPVLRHDLREIDFGQAGGLTVDEFRRRWPEQAQRWEDYANLDFRWPGGESRGEFQQRAVRAMEELVRGHLGQRIIVVAHTGSLRCYLAHLFLGAASRWREIPLRPASISQIRVGPELSQMILLDDLSYLQETKEV